VRVGYETYGKLNADGNNAISSRISSPAPRTPPGGTRRTKKVAGYWDAIIGPGKAIDTDKYFVVSADALTNLKREEPDGRHHRPGDDQPGHRKP